LGKFPNIPHWEGACLPLEIGGRTMKNSSRSGGEITTWERTYRPGRPGLFFRTEKIEGKGEWFERSLKKKKNDKKGN